MPVFAYEIPLPCVHLPAAFSEKDLPPTYLIKFWYFQVFTLHYFRLKQLIKMLKEAFNETGLESGRLEST